MPAVAFFWNSEAFSVGAPSSLSDNTPTPTTSTFAQDSTSNPPLSNSIYQSPPQNYYMYTPAMLEFLASMRFITLLRDNTRKNHITSICNQYGLNTSVAIVPAVDIATLSSSVIPELQRQGYLSKPLFKSFRRTPGQIAALKSHVSVWERLASTPGPDSMFFTIFEDDVGFSPYFLGNMSGVMQELPEDWDFCYLFVHPKQVDKNVRTIPGKKFINKAVYTYGLGKTFLTRDY